MKFENVAVDDSVVGSNFLAIKACGSPYPGLLEATGDVFVHEAIHVVDDLATAYGERPSDVGWLAGDLCVDPDDFEVIHEPATSHR